MTERPWLRLIDAFCSQEGLQSARRRLQASDTYRAAYAEWACGAADTVVCSLLRRAVLEMR